MAPLHYLHLVAVVNEMLRAGCDVKLQVRLAAPSTSSGTLSQNGSPDHCCSRLTSSYTHPAALRAGALALASLLGQKCQGLGV